MSVHGTGSREAWPTRSPSGGQFGPPATTEVLTVVPEAALGADNWLPSGGWA